MMGSLNDKSLYKSMNVRIGNVGNGDWSTPNRKTVSFDTKIKIPRNAFFAFDYKKYSKYLDRFEFEVRILKNDQVINLTCIRTDVNHGWGQNLLVEMLIFTNMNMQLKNPNFVEAKKITFEKNPDKQTTKDKSDENNMELKKKVLKILDDQTCEFSNNIELISLWNKRKNLGIDKFPEYANIKNKMIIRLEILQISRIESVIEKIDSALPNYSSQKAENTISGVFGESGLDIIQRLGSSFYNESWRNEYLLKSMYVQICFGEKLEDNFERVWELIKYINENVTLCSARRMECWFVILEGAAALTQSQHQNKSNEIQENDETIKLKNFLINYIHDIRQEAFNKIFMAPTKKYYDRTYQEVRSFDTYIHGYNTYACLLLATLGVQLDKPIVFDDEAKSIVEFLEIPQFANEVILDFWAKKKWIKNSNRLSRTLKNDNCFIFPGHEPLQIAINSISDKFPHQNRLKLCQYLEYFALEFSKEKMLLKLANKILERSQLALSVLNRLLAKIGNSNMPISNINEYLWDIEEEDPTKMMREQNILSFLKFLEIVI